jgi:hypothetical protein
MKLSDFRVIAQPQPNEIYQSRIGRKFCVQSVAIHASEGVVFVNYYLTDEPDMVYTLELNEWNKPLPNGQKRFTLIGETC